MRADEPIDYGYVGLPLYDELIDYINQLRYDRAMRGAKIARDAAHKYHVEAVWLGASLARQKICTKNELRWIAIAEAYEARAKRIKEGK